MSSLKEASAVLDAHDGDSALRNHAALTTADSPETTNANAGYEEKDMSNKPIGNDDKCAEPINFRGINDSIETSHKRVQESAMLRKESIFTPEKEQVNALPSEHFECGVDSITKGDIKDVKTPGIVETVIEEVEAVTHTFHGKLDLKDNEPSESTQEEEPGYLSRILKKVGSFFR